MLHTFFYKAIPQGARYFLVNVYMHALLKECRSKKHYLPPKTDVTGFLPEFLLVVSDENVIDDFDLEELA